MVAKLKLAPMGQRPPAIGSFRAPPFASYPETQPALSRLGAPSARNCASGMPSV